jgi:serine protease Do
MYLRKKPLALAFLFVTALLLIAAQSPVAAQGQIKSPKETVEIKSSPKFLAAFRDVVANAAKSTVRVQCDGKNVALGVVVHTDGFILTKHSDLTDKITVRFANGTQMDAQIVGVDEAHDVAMLKVAANNLTPIVWHDSSAAPVGNFVASAGVGGDALCVGVVSVASRKMPAGKAAIKPSPKSGYLGVALEDAENEKGARVKSVQPNSAAEKAQLKVDDIINAVNEIRIKDTEALVRTLQKFKPGETVTLKVLRDDTPMEIKAKLGKRPADLDRADFQNNMGSELSKRRDGFPTVLQHDSVVLPSDCGGPLVDLEGRVIGINIARAGRVESYAIPSEAIRPLLADLMSGKLAPKR